jgi:hypothetical protein
MDDGYTNMSLDFNFTYFDNIYTEISVSSNGYLCLGSNELCNQLTRPSSYDTLVGLNYDLDASRDQSGQIYVKSLSFDSNEFTYAKVYVNLLDPEFTPTNIIMITYDDVFTSDPSNFYSTASFQVFLLASSKKSYVLFKFKSCLTDLFLRASSGVTHDDMSTLKEVRIADGQQCTSSNVGQTGIWVSDVTTSSSGIYLKGFPRIYSCKSSW